MAKVLIISGHGYGDNGAVSIHGVEKIMTKNYAWLVHGFLSRAIETHVYPVDRDCYQDVINGQCAVRFADYDYVLEIHINSGARDIEGDGVTTGTEIFIAPNETNVQLAESIVNAVAKNGLKQRGLKRTSDYCVLRTSALYTHASLLEIGFIDDKDDMIIMGGKDRKIALDIANAISAYYGSGVIMDETTVKPAWYAYKAQAGDTIANISRSQGVPISTIVIDNPQLIKAGQLLTLHTRQGAWKKYKVQKVDTLANISRWLDTPIESIVKDNDLVSANDVIALHKI